MKGRTMKDYDNIITELSCVADLLDILCLVSTEAQARDGSTPSRDVMANALYAVENHIRRISEELGTFEAERQPPA